MKLTSFLTHELKKDKGMTHLSGILWTHKQEGLYWYSNGALVLRCTQDELDELPRCLIPDLPAGGQIIRYKSGAQDAVFEIGALRDRWEGMWEWAQWPPAGFSHVHPLQWMRLNEGRGFAQDCNAVADDATPTIHQGYVDMILRSESGDDVSWVVRKFPRQDWRKCPVYVYGAGEELIAVCTWQGVAEYVWEKPGEAKDRKPPNDDGLLSGVKSEHCSECGKAADVDADGLCEHCASYAGANA